MRPDERDAAHVWDMLQAVKEIEAMMVHADLAFFLKNRMLMRAIERDLEILGEAARRVSADFRAARGLTEFSPTK